VRSFDQNTQKRGTWKKRRDTAGHLHDFLSKYSAGCDLLARHVRGACKKLLL